MELLKFYSYLKKYLVSNRGGDFEASLICVYLFVNDIKLGRYVLLIHKVP